MVKQELKHEEVWDDSALVNSWNEALSEYKKYHSLAAKGEKVNVTLDRVEEDITDVVASQAVDEEKEEKPKHDHDQPAMTNGHAIYSKPERPATSPTEAHQVPNAPTMLPQALLNTVQDEGMRNLMMSWYYAGYYTGLYEGQQKAYASVQQGG
ncbi:hypothetical protein LTR08_003354 [Meristemomyces frigidus]|nr:hypothetical protein LTR08_003354 [Meristemomyces frigidus]